MRFYNCYRFPRYLHPLTRLAQRFSSLLSFLVIHTALYFVWKLTFGVGIWENAYPKARTQLVVVIHSGLLWAVVGLLAPSVKECALAWRGRRMAYHPLEDPLELDNDHSASAHSRHRRSTSFSLYKRPKTFSYWLLIAFYTFAAVTYQNAGDHRFRPIVKEANRLRKPSGYGTGEKVFIAAMFYNNQDILPHWSREMLKVAHYVGTDNVFFSIVESHSGDRTPDLLREFQRKLTADGIQHQIIVQDTSIIRPTSDDVRLRIQFLSAVRNLALASLIEGTPALYDRVIFSNDILVEADSVVELLNTRNGEYDMVCGTDTGPWGLYDAWVIRDKLGQLVSSLWPYFLEEAGRRAVWWEEPVPVFSCWGGIAVFRADPLLPIPLRKSGRLSTSRLTQPLPESHPAYSAGNLTSPALTPPVKFRASGPDECLSSECFLFPYDLRRQFLLDKIYVNPRVIVSYMWRHYIWYKYVTRHWLVMWWMKNVERGDEESMRAARMTIGSVDGAYDWDGGKCMRW